jgi:perosamine synthetase
MRSHNESWSPSWPVADDNVRRVMEQFVKDGTWGRYHGPHCDRLREALAAFHSIEHVHLCSSGTSAIELCLRSVNVQPRDEVILAAYDYKANLANVLAMGARPVLVDTQPDRPVMDVEQLTAALSPQTKAIICSHLHGCMASIDDVMVFAREHDLSVIEDACQVPGASIGDRRAGTIGHVGALSFGGSKLLTAGRGGAVLTHNAAMAQRVRLYTQRGNDAYPLSEMQAAVLLPQLEQLDARNRQRRSAVEMIRASMPTTAPVTMLWDGTDNADPSWYKLAFLLNGASVEQRDEFAHQKRTAGVALDAGFSALHLTHAKSRFRKVGDLAHAAALHAQLLTLHHPVLLSDRSVLTSVAALLGE